MSSTGNKTIGQSTSHTNTATISNMIPVGTGTSVKILDAEIVAEGQNPTRMGIIISAVKKDIFVKFQPASTDNDTKGIFIPKDSTLVINVSDMYFGEISAISASGNAEVYVTEL